MMGHEPNYEIWTLKHFSWYFKQVLEEEVEEGSQEILCTNFQLTFVDLAGVDSLRHVNI